MRKPISKDVRAEFLHQRGRGGGSAAGRQQIVNKYADVVVQRWQQLSGKEATLEGDGRTFDAIVRDRARKAEGQA